MCNFGEGGKKQASKIPSARARNAEDSRRVGTPSCRMFSSEFRRACACISPVLLSLAKIISKSQSIRDIWALNLCDIDGDDDDYESATNDDDMIEHVSNDCGN